MITTIADALLTDVLAEPWDDCLRGIYADWLEDHGDPDAAGWRAGPPARVDALPPWQSALLPLVRDHWLRVGLATGPADRDTAWDAVRDAYAAAELKPPTVQIWLDSPLAGSVGAAMLAGVRAQVGAQVGDQVRAQVWDQVGDQVGDQVRAQVRAQVWDQVGDQVGDQVRAQVWAQVGDQVRDQVYRSGYGQHDAGWLSYYAALLATSRLHTCRRLVPLMRLAGSCGWWWPFEGAVILTERPAEIKMRGGKLVRAVYPDGFAAGKEGGK